MLILGTELGLRANCKVPQGSDMPRAPWSSLFSFMSENHFWSRKAPGTENVSEKGSYETNKKVLQRTSHLIWIIAKSRWTRIGIRQSFIFFHDFSISGWPDFWRPEREITTRRQSQRYRGKPKRGNEDFPSQSLSSLKYTFFIQTWDSWWLKLIEIKKAKTQAC